MKRILSMLALALFVGGSVIGCEASAKVDPDTDSYHSDSYHSDSSYKKTTTVEPNGDTVTHTEVHHD